MRKLRPRTHIIEDLGFNHVERQILLAGYLYHRFYRDYGYDGAFQLFDKTGEVDNRMVFFQLKSSDHLKYIPEKDVFAFDLSERDLALWLSNLLVVYLILYDARKNRAYYLELQDYFKQNRLDLRDVIKFVRVYVPRQNRFTSRFIKKIKV